MTPQPVQLLTRRVCRWLANSTVVSMFAVALPTQAITISIQPSSQTVDLGSSVSLDVGISGLGDGVAPSLSTFDFNVRFDPAILSFSSISFGDPVLGDQLGPISGSLTDFSVDPVTGVNQFAVSLELDPVEFDKLQADSFTLTSITFSTVGLGTSSLVLSDIVLGDFWGAPLDASTGDGSVTVIVSAVPEGAPGFAAVLALLGLCLAHAQSTWNRRPA